MTNKGIFFLSELSLGAWNINGIWQRINNFKYNKIHNPLFSEIFKNKKIFCLLETHHTDSETGDLHING